MTIREALSHPTRAVPLGFLAAIAIGTSLLSLPIARAGDGGASFMTALFTATSAVCVTGLTVVDTGTYWSPFGQGVVLLLIQLGGLGIMTAATLLGMLVTNRTRLGQRLLAQVETGISTLGDVTATLRLVLIVTLIVQSAIAALLFARLLLGYGQPVGTAAWQALFHAVSAFNNAGFGLYPDNVTRFALDPLVLVPLMIAIVIGGIGFPVLYELKRELWRPRCWSLHTKLTLTGTALLIPLGAFAVLAFESWNAATIGGMSAGDKLLNAVFHSVSTRTAGFNAVDVGAMRPETLLASIGLMMIGGGSAGTAGGIKVGTFLVLGLIVYAEVQGERDPVAFRRRIGGETQRLALTIALLSIGTVAAAVFTLLSMTRFDLETIMFEAVSAFATVGLSTGITADLPPAGQAILVALMFAGRVGTVTIAAALALRQCKRPYRYPEECPILG